MKNLREFTENFITGIGNKKIQIEHSELNTATEELIAYFKAARVFEREWLKENKHCPICDVKLDQNNSNPEDPYEYWHCCKEHQEYNCMYQITHIRKKLGFPDERSIGNFFY